MHVAVAGTFGPVHDGHRRLFEHALRFGDEGVTVGLTTNALAEETRGEPRPVPTYEERRRGVEKTLESVDRWGRSWTIRPLDDVYGIATEEPAIDGLVVSPETATELGAINDRRRERGFEPLTGIVSPRVLADDGERLSSTRVVAGEVDEHGRLL